MTNLPTWVERDRETMRRDAKPVADTYHEAYSHAQRRLARPGEREKLEAAVTYLEHMLDEHIGHCQIALAAHKATSKPPRGKILEGLRWIGWVPHHLAYGMGWRMRPAFEILARHGHPEVLQDFHEWADKFLIRCQTMLDAHNALGRKESRIGDSAVPLFELLISDALDGVTRLVGMICLDKKLAKRFTYFHKLAEQYRTK